MAENHICSVSEGLGSILSTRIKLKKKKRNFLKNKVPGAVGEDSWLNDKGIQKPNGPFSPQILGNSKDPDPLLAVIS